MHVDALLQEPAHGVDVAALLGAPRGDDHSRLRVDGAQIFQRVQVEIYLVRQPEPCVAGRAAGGEKAFERAKRGEWVEVSFEHQERTRVEAAR